MDYRNCKICREPFVSYNSLLCPKCQKQTDKDFITVRDYIYDNPQNASVDKIAEATGVNEKIILYLLEENRLTAAGAITETSELHCRVCGRVVSAGSICDFCRASLVKDLGMAASNLRGKKSYKPTFAMARGDGRYSRSATEHDNKSKK